MKTRPTNSGIHHNRWLVYIPLVALIGINLAGIFYTTNLSDFNTFILAGQAIRSGESPYADSAEQPTNLNPPFSLIVLEIIPEGNAITYYRTWRIISLILYTVLVIILAMNYRELTTPTHILWAFSMTGIWYTLLMGQIYVVLLGLVLSAWISLEKDRIILAGIVIGVLAAIKPNFLVWPALLLFGGNWIPALGGFVTFGALSLLPAFVYGSGIYAEWLEMLASYKAAPLATNMSIYGFFSRLHLDQVGVIIAVVFLLILGIWVWRNNPESKMISSLAIPAALLATQYAWVGYAILLLPIFFYRRTSWMIALSAVLFCIPSILVYTLGKESDVMQIFAGLIYFSALVFLMVELLFSTYFNSLQIGRSTFQD